MKLSRLDLADTQTATRLLELQRRSYAMEAELIGSDGIPPLSETLEELQSCGETFLGALVDGSLAGAISWRLVDGTIDLHRLVVDPPHFRRGIGASLVRAALSAEPTAACAVVQTGADNEPARTLYEREGFEQIDEVEVVPGLRVARFAKSLT